MVGSISRNVWRRWTDAERGDRINTESVPQLIAVFSTIVFVFGMGFGIQRFRPLGEQTLAQLAGLVVEILLPFYLFFTTATEATPEALSAAPLLIVMGVAVTLLGYPLARLVMAPSGVAGKQRSVFHFAIMVGNTAFLGIPVCEALFGPLGAVYAVLYDFGTTLAALTVGIWALSGGRLSNWRPLLLNPLIWGVVAGLLWAAVGWSFPEWLARPFSTLGGATLPLALLVGGAQIGSIRSHATQWGQQLAGLITTRLVVVPLVVASVLALFGWRNLAASVIIVQSAMPVGLTTSIMAKNYGGDAEFAASATMWSTVVALMTLPLVALLLI